jgi:hypothetical protein
MRIRTAILGALAGAAAAYLFDPISGGSRRARLRASISRVARRPGSRKEDRPPLPENLSPTQADTPDVRVARAATTEGVEAGSPRRPTEELSAGLLGAREGEDARIAGQVRATLQRRPDLGADDLVIDVVNGVAYLSGDLHDQNTFGEVVDLTREIPGVRRVQSLLHLPPSETIPGATVRPSDDQDTE